MKLPQKSMPQIDPDANYLHYHQSGIRLYEEGKNQAAIEAYEKAITLNPAYFWSH